MKKILVVDDNETNMRLFKAVLQKSGYEVLEAVDGIEGIKVAKKELPGLIFMDIQMPLMDGAEAMRLLKADGATANIPVVALTSYAMSGDNEKFINIGFNGYLTKPVDIDLFLELARKYVG